MRTCRNCGASAASNEKFCTKCGSGDIFDSQNQVSEFKRTCNQCGASWHSLTKRENVISKNIQGAKAAQCCNMCDANARNRAQDQVNTYENELDRLKKCPKCGSGDFKEELIVYDKK